MIGFLSWLSSELKLNSCDIFIAVTNKDLRKSNIQFNEWLNSDYGYIFYSTYIFNFLPFRLLNQIRKKIKNVDILHANGILYPVSLLSVLMAIILRTKVVWSVHGELDPEALKYNSVVKLLYINVIRILLAKRVMWLSTCNAETTYIKKYFGENVRIAQIPISMKLPKNLNLVKTNQFLYLGRIHPKKAIENLILALSMSRTFLYSTYILNIVGNSDNEYGEQLKELVKRHSLDLRVNFLGLIQGESKLELICSSKYLIMPSHTENFGIVVIEALAQSTPVIASKGTPWNILQSRQAGYWVDNDPESLSLVIDEVINHSDENYNTLKTNAFNLADSKFNIERNVIEWISLYNSVANETNT